MKTIHTFFSLLALSTLLLLGACEEQRILFEGPDFVRFTDTAQVFRESYERPISVKVHVVGKALTQAVTVNYTIGGTAREGRDYVIEGTRGVVTIPANEYFGTINVRLINNANNILDSQDIVFTLTDVSPNDQLQVGFGINNIVGKSFRLTIQDDCLLSGFYTGTLQGYNDRVENIEITSSDCRLYRISTWNIGIFSLNATKTPLTFIDNGDNTLTIPAQISTELAPPYDTLRGNGLWNPQTRAILLNLQIKVPYNSTRDTVLTLPFTYTPRR
ncbi:hypothetical protein GCM10027275_07960 [Rhabdobacter roseus]|uniref:DUF4843 domain-containing protein n=1 Tax=Rhabdobacter roseus TaxID=1655419 RepID=A0A840TF01_9BACT|nr:Calx-beta domain-containing protein [Rhabdobacter roseus]MBB5282696.1 hypothetical protein [Rhabdobacter roseus]